MSRLVFMDAAGRELSLDELKGFTGTLRWQIVGDERISAEAGRLHREARGAGERGDYPRALDLLEQAHQIAPGWAYPLYDMAFTHLLQGDTTRAEELYAQVDELEPRGFFTCKTTLDTLRREHAGRLFPGFCDAFVKLEWLGDQTQKQAVLRGIVARFPDFPPAWKQLSDLVTDPAERMQAVESGLAGAPDADTLGGLLVTKAGLMHHNGDHDAAIGILTELAADPASTLSTEAWARVALAGLDGR